MAEEERKNFQEELLNVERKVIGLTSERQRLEEMVEKGRKEEVN